MLTINCDLDKIIIKIIFNLSCQVRNKQIFSCRFADKILANIVQINEAEVEINERNDETNIGRMYSFRVVKLVGRYIIMNNFDINYFEHLKILLKINLEN